MVLVRFVFAQNANSGALPSTSELSLFRVHRNTRATLRSIRFTSTYDGGGYPLHIMDDIPYLAEISLGSWLHENECSNVHQAGAQAHHAPSFEVNSANPSSFSTVLVPSSVGLWRTTFGFLEGIVSYDQQLDLDFGIIPHVPRHLSAELIIYTASGHRMSKIPTVEIVFEFN